MDRFSDAGASHTAKSLRQNLVIIFCEIKIRPIVLNTNKTALIMVFELSYPSQIPFCAQPCSEMENVL